MATAAESQLRARPGQAAFLRISRGNIWGQPLSGQGFNRLISEAVVALLDGHYTYSSLRVGFIRTALRANQPAHRVAAHAHLRELSSVAVHERRENVIRRSVAGRLGL